jgi:undecaprenyl-phosphate 4-deoxy-4-formamido-L-arabinose transferase
MHSMPDSTRPALSAVIGCHFEEHSIEEFHARLAAALESTGHCYEIVYVNDGSTDGTLRALEAIFERSPRVSAVVDLFRNAGQAAALTAGTTFATGDILVYMDSDLQLDPEDLPRLLAAYDEGVDVVSGYRENRRDSLTRTLPSRLANRVMRRVARADMRDFGCTFKLIDAQLVRAFEFGPLKPIRLPYLIAAAGRTCEVPVAHHPRRYGSSGWTFAKLFRYWMDSVVGASERPFQWLSGALLLVGILFVLRVAVNLLWPFSLMAEVTNGLLLNAVVLSFLIGVGVSAAIGEYVLRSYFLLLRHPAYVVRSVRSREPVDFARAPAASGLVGGSDS